MSKTIKQRVASGVAFLNINYPNWLNKINLDILDIESLTNCILGQIEGRYSLAQEKFNYEIDGSGCGFSWDSDYGVVEDSSALNAEWKRVITKLRKEVKPKLKTKPQTQFLAKYSNGAKYSFPAANWIAAVAEADRVSSDTISLLTVEVEA